MTIKHPRHKKPPKANELAAPWKIVNMQSGPGGLPHASIVDANGREILFNIYSANLMHEEDALETAQFIVNAVNWYCKKNKSKLKGKKQEYGIKAYGSWQYFDSKNKFRSYLMEWISATEGAERDRAVLALSNLEQGITMTDTDAKEEI